MRRAALLLATATVLSIAALEFFCQNTLKVRRRAPSVPIVSSPGDDPFWSTVAIPARDHAQLEASFVTPKQHTGKCVLALHGVSANRDSLRRFIALFTANGYRVLAPDSRAHGASGGDLITYGALEKFDALDWAHWLKGEGCQAIYGFGQSLGASILIEAAGTEPAFRSLVAEAPFADLRSVAETRVQLYGHLPNWAQFVSKAGVESAMLYARVRYATDLSHVSPIEDIAHVQVPVLLIHGLADESTPPSNSEALKKAAPNAVLWLVPGARHAGASVTAPEEFNRRVLDWFARS